MLWKNERQGTWRKNIEEALRRRSHVGRHLCNLFAPTHVDDQRIVCRPSLCLEDATHRIWLKGVRAYPIDRFGGKGDQFTATKVSGRLRGRCCEGGRHETEATTSSNRLSKWEEPAEAVDFPPDPLLASKARLPPQPASTRMSPDAFLPDDRSSTEDVTLGSVPSGPEITRTLVEAARRVLRRRFRVVLLIRDAYAHMEANAGALTAVWNDLRTTLRLLVAWARRSYREVSAASLVLLVAALLYFVTPVDVIPDTLGALGFVDDLAVIQTAVETVRDELDQFRDWEEGRALPSKS